jgi:hypothetical protein
MEQLVDLAKDTSNELAFSRLRVGHHRPINLHRL